MDKREREIREDFFENPAITRQDEDIIYLLRLLNIEREKIKKLEEKLQDVWYDAMGEDV